MMINRSAGLIALALILLSLPVLMGDIIVAFELTLGPATPENLMLLRSVDLGLNTVLVGWAIGRYAAIPTVMPDLIDQNVTHDFLTGLGNRKAVDKMLAVTTAKACKNNEWLSIVLADMDLFRQFNKQFGNNSGDRCLVQVASILGEHIGQQDHYLGRYGGEKFAIILPYANPRQAVLSAEKLRTAVAEADIVLEDSSLQKVTLTFGVASIRTDRDMDPVELIELAQQRLLSAKKAGRNQVQSVQISDSQPPVPRISRLIERDDSHAPLMAAR
ncbi:MAG: diguanylate cyclase (GGDEF)-like protein [Halioglobus sp.]|jgi:diguanylate cyclase (GGDEF)-like protein